MIRTKRRRWWIALLLSVCYTGLGQMYVGRARRGIFQLGSVLLLGVAAVILAKTALTPALMLGAAGLVLTLLSVVDAAVLAARTEPQPQKWYNRWYLYLLAWCSCIALAGVASRTLREHYLEAFKIPSTTMEPVIRYGDYILVDKRAYRNAAPAVGDIVVVNLPDDPSTEEDESRINILKRVVAAEGDEIELRGTQLRRNGVVINEPFAQYLDGGRRGLGPLKVPSGKLILLGDNRDHSKDSRYWRDPLLDVSRARGKALVVYWSIEDRTRIGLRLD